jgi:hypothetical protein
VHGEQQGLLRRPHQAVYPTRRRGLARLSAGIPSSGSASSAGGPTERNDAFRQKKRDAMRHARERTDELSCREGRLCALGQPLPEHSHTSSARSRTDSLLGNGVRRHR